MKILGLVQTNFATIGINPNRSRRQHLSNAKISIGFLILSCFFICSFIFAISEAETFTEYTQSIYMISTVAFIILAFAIIIFNVEKMFELINDCENIADISECVRLILSSNSNVL